MKNQFVALAVALVAALSLPPPKAFGSPIAHAMPGASRISAARSEMKSSNANLQLVDWTVPKPRAGLKCKLRALQKIGWTIETSPAAKKASADITSPCGYADLEQARRAGDLKLTLPSRIRGEAQEREVEAIADEALTGIGTQCVYSMKLSKAVERATRKLSKNHWYHFRIPIGIDLIRLGGNKAWKNLACEEGACYIPSGSNAEAIESLYTSWFSSECATGLQIAEFASIYELFGAKEFDRRFRSDEIFVGAWDSVEKSASPTNGALGRKVKDTSGLQYAINGYQMLAGVSGYIGNTLGEQFVDVGVDRGQNFIVARASPEAGQALYRNGGFAFYNKMNEKIWKLSRGIAKERMRLALGTPWQIQTADADAETRDRLMKMRELLQDPVYRDIIVYVHAPGHLSLGEHIVRLLELNPRTPYEFKFYSEALHGEVFDRWLKMQLDECE